ncbi:type II toxin-antitoxin system RelE/ParE family toxin [Methylobacterium sp. WL120]|uniref:type II toxin-antitoxin system RelE/ParE family toxin n=1 Tax=Methylobacterium sp. WL120 TaxID=2603887 RepID=UPI0011C76831|nr:type II toxin-antitoxin system RelE/ParE family toxin [Methylobacterium sp. WL120]TXM69538.1 type II toxin-antitoxin system RelE/ParE family toxin [Methylobacterium sp. WL120]
MRLRFTLPAARQLDRILTTIGEQHPTGAHNVQERIRAVIDVLQQQPQAGAATARPGGRRMVVRPYSYAVADRIGDDKIVILGVRHTARRPLA